MLVERLDFNIPFLKICRKKNYLVEREDMIFFENHQDERNSTPATKKGKPNCHVQAKRLAKPQGLRRPKPLPKNKETKTRIVPAGHVRHHDTIQPIRAIPKYPR